MRDTRMLRDEELCRYTLSDKEATEREKDLARRLERIIYQMDDVESDAGRFQNGQLELFPRYDS